MALGAFILARWGLVTRDRCGDKRAMRFALGISLLSIAACVSLPPPAPGPTDEEVARAQLQQQARARKAERVRVGKGDPAGAVVELGPVEGVDGSGCGSAGFRGTYEQAYWDLKIAAAELGADYVQIITVTEPGAIELPQGEAQRFGRRELACQQNRFVIRGTAFRSREPAGSVSAR